MCNHNIKLLCACQKELTHYALFMYKNIFMNTTSLDFEEKTNKSGLTGGFIPGKY